MSVKYISGRAMVPSGHQDGHYVPVSLPGASEAARRREAEQREAAAAEVAKVRAAVERDVRLGGAPESQIKAIVDKAMAEYHARRAVEAAELGDRQSRELRAYFKHQASSAMRFDEPDHTGAGGDGG